MDPSLTRDPVVLLAELIDLLREIKDAGHAEQAAAAVAAIRHVAARSNEENVPSAALATPHLRTGITSHSPEPSAHHSAEPHQPEEPIAVTRVSEAVVVAPLPPVESLVPAIFAEAPPTDTHVAHISLSHSSPGPASIPSSSNAASPPATTVPSVTVRPPTSKNTRIPAPIQDTSRPKIPDDVKAGPITRKPRNLIVCIDGTSNQFSSKNTNVVELYHRLIKDDEQLTLYNSGIGTYATPSWKSLKYIKQVLYNKIDLAIAWNLEKILLSAYLWLCENYREGDRIYLFGFSRGAYQVRGLSAMIESVGLLYKGNQDQIPFAYQLYAETKHFARVEAMRARFKQTFSWAVKVELVAVWDTVSSVGLFRDKILPGTTDGMKHVKYFRHALALHERRVKFLPENAREGLGPAADQVTAEAGQRPHTKEVWFAGSHSNIGGGAMPNEDMNAFGPALRWMTFEATLAGVRLKDAPQRWEDTAISNSLTAGWKIFEVFPFGRLTYQSKSGLTHRPHLGRARKIQEHQLIHETALSHLEAPNHARWRARLPASVAWDEGALRLHNLVEADPFTAAGQYVEKIATPGFSALSSDDLVGLRTLVSTDVGRRSMLDIETARETLNHGLRRVLAQVGSIEPRLVHPTLDVLLLVMERCGFVDAKSIVPEAREHARIIARSDEELARRFMKFCGSAMVCDPLEHPDYVSCVAFMPDGDRIVSGCYDCVVRIWNIETGEVVGAAMTGHTERVWSVAVSADGTKIASGSDDNTIRLWSVETGAMIALLEGQERGVNSVAFSPDGLRVVSGSDDITIRVWDVASGKTIVGPIPGHTYAVNSVAYSFDGSQIVSGSFDDTVRVWNAETGDELWRVEMPSPVWSVAYSPDGNRIVAGCWNGSVRVLDAETGEIVLGSLTGHSDAVWTVAFSPDGTQIASGSSDDTVRLWDAETGEELDVLREHRDSVISIAFSPDGKHVASASEDKTVRIWDATGKWKRL